MNTQFSFRTLIPVALFLFFTSALGAQCANPDYDGLEKFYQATNGDDWKDNTGWLTDCEPCGWTGIECDAAGRVVTILLRENGLTGTLPTDFGSLTELRHLAIPRNDVAGPIPAAVFDLLELRDLNLARNKFTGSLSNDITQLTELEYLRLGRNEFTGLLPTDLSSCTRLKVITLEENKFTDRIPQGLGDLPDLEAISLYNNDLDGCFPEDLADLCSRTRVSFGGNPKLSWEGDFDRLCLGSVADVEQTGAPCDDGDSATQNTVITENCRCGVPNGPNGQPTEGPGIGEFDETNVTQQQTQGLVGIGNSPGILPTAAATVSRLTAFPNPLVGSTLNVRLPETMNGAEVRLLSLTGRELSRATNVSTGFSLSVPVLEAGIYLLEAVSGTERNVTRVIVQ